MAYVQLHVMVVCVFYNNIALLRSGSIQKIGTISLSYSEKFLISINRPNNEQDRYLALTD